MKTIKYSKTQGFSLIEIMIVVAIVGVLAAVAYPSYLDQVHKSKRATAATSLLECASILERRFTIQQSYDADACDGLQNDDYTISVAISCVTEGNSNCFDVTATAGPSLDADEACQTLSLSHLNAKSATRADGSDSENSICWRTS